MSRLSMDTFAPGSSVGRVRSAPGALDLIRPEGTGFGEHLQRAARDAQPTSPSAPSDSNGPGEAKATVEPDSAPAEPQRPEPRKAESPPAEPADSRSADTTDAKPESETDADTTSDKKDKTETDVADPPAGEEEQGDEPTAEDRDETAGEVADANAIAISTKLAMEEPAKTGDTQATDAKPQAPATAVEATPSRRSRAAVQQEQTAARLAAQETSGTEIATTESAEAAAGAEPAAKSNSRKGDVVAASEESRVQAKPVPEVPVKGEAPAPDPAATDNQVKVVDPSAASAGDRGAKTKEPRRSAAAERVEASKAANPQQDASAGTNAVQPTAPAASEDAADRAASVAKAAIEASPRDAAPAAPAPTGREATAQGRTSDGEAVRPAAAAPSGTNDNAAHAVDRVRFVERVARAFGSGSQDGGVVRMRLHPPELGSMRIEIAMRDGAMTARLETDTAEARNLLLDNLPALRERLAQQEIKIERFEVAYNQSGLGGGSPEGPDDRRSARGTSGRNPGAATESSQPAEPAARRGVALPGQGTRLDVFV